MKGKIATQPVYKPYNQHERATSTRQCIPSTENAVRRRGREPPNHTNEGVHTAIASSLNAMHLKVRHTQFEGTTHSPDVLDGPRHRQLEGIMSRHRGGPPLNHGMLASLATFSFSLVLQFHLNSYPQLFSKMAMMARRRARKIA